MSLVHAFLVLAVLMPRAAVYVKGHSRAAIKAREDLELFTCYRVREVSEGSPAILHVDHLLTRSGSHKVIITLVDDQKNTLWEGKAEEYPWPLPSPVDGLLKNMARSTCINRGLPLPAKSAHLEK